MLFYGVDCLRVDANTTEKLSIIWNTAFRWVLGVRRSEHMRNKLRLCGAMAFKFLIDMKFLLFLHNLKCCNITSLLLHRLANWSSEVMKLLQYGLWSITCGDAIKLSVVQAFDLHCQCFLFFSFMHVISVNYCLTFL